MANSFLDQSSMGRRRQTDQLIHVAADVFSWYCAFLLLTLLLLSCDDGPDADLVVRGPRRLSERACEEIYVVGEGETLNSISDKCDDPFIVERNPHIHDPDDVFPGLVIKITPSKSSNSRKLQSS